MTASEGDLTLTIERLLACKALCEHCASACLEDEDIDVLRQCISLTHDCASLCDLTAVLLIRHGEATSSLLDKVVALCIEACEQAAAECASHASRHDHCAECATACGECVEACRSLLTVAA